jgi:hypothetical protein
MKPLRTILATAALGTTLLATSFGVGAAPTATRLGGDTNVALAASFLSALESLGVTPGAVFPGQIESINGAPHAVFPITTGALDFGSVSGEIDHSGGLSLTAGSTRVELTGYAIDLYGTTPVLTGLVSADGNFVGRIPLFDLDLSSVRIAKGSGVIRIRDVGLTLDPVAATALSGVFGTTVPAHIAVGTANVTATYPAAN